MANDAPRASTAWIGYAAWIGVIVMATAFYSPWDDFDLQHAALIAVLIPFAIAIPFVEATERPRRNYLRVGLGVAALGLALIAMPVLMGAGLWIGLILWSSLSATLLAWVRFYERTEPS